MSATDALASKRGQLHTVLYATAILSFLCILFVLVYVPPNRGLKRAWPSASMQMCRTIDLAMFSYAGDHNGKYPDGSSSTEVFQQLLDGQYITDPAIFYLPLTGKNRAIAGQKLKPKNVCFDVTSGVTSDSPDGLPVVFLTGYEVTYAPGASAILINELYDPDRSWFDWLIGRVPTNEGKFPGVAVAYKNNTAMFLKIIVATDDKASVPNFVPQDFKPDGKTYLQLTPDGVLP